MITTVHYDVVRTTNEETAEDESKRAFDRRICYICLYFAFNANSWQILSWSTNHFEKIYVLDDMSRAAWKLQNSQFFSSSPMFFFLFPIFDWIAMIWIFPHVSPIGRTTHNNKAIKKSHESWSIVFICVCIFLCMCNVLFTASNLIIVGCAFWRISNNLYEWRDLEREKLIWFNASETRLNKQLLEWWFRSNNMNVFCYIYDETWSKYLYSISARMRTSNWMNFYLTFLCLNQFSNQS